MRRLQRRHLLGFMAGLTALTGLTACGFTPIYAQKDLGLKLAHIDLVTPETRTGYFVRNRLVTTLNINESEPKLYRLTVTLRERRYDVGLQVDDTAVRAEISNAVTYTLTDIKTRRVITRGNFVDTTTYDTSNQSPYVGVVAQKDGQERAAISVADRIHSELALYFHGQQ
ncbi:MAG: hypothetical protein AAGC58_08695 [Asticcacaulis sp.]|uniref:hypothetical protein n=1 Tax=Asticcacaulis tiandongensis TaxID=2565365 RepID=UPI00112DDC86|nr:hypothetical protein [Asticcacaulis tiandongensis]